MRTNALLEKLPPAVAQRLLAEHQRRVVVKRTVLHEAGDMFEHAYFPLNGMLSLLSTTEDGGTIEVMAVGREGMIGLPILLPSAEAQYSVHIRLPAEVIQVKAAVLRHEIRSSAALQEVFFTYVQELLQAMSQLAVCHRFHSSRQRLCRWLLSTHDHANSSVLNLTQENIAESLGIPRTGVTAIAVELQDMGAIRCRHGRITILSRSRIEAIACDCSRITPHRDRSLAGAGGLSATSR